MLLHASCAARGVERVAADAPSGVTAAVLLFGPAGSGKSDVVLRLLDAGWMLVADDQVCVEAAAGDVRATSPAALSGRLEVRGLGLFEGLPVAKAPIVRLAVRLAGRDAVPRLPEPATHECAGIPLPLVVLHAFDAATPARIGWALDAVQGRRRLSTGAFASA